MRDEDLNRVFEFGQAEHHKTKTYHDEYCETLKAYGIEYDERYAFRD